MGHRSLEVMASRQRKTLVVCLQCHLAIHGDQRAMGPQFERRARHLAMAARAASMSADGLVSGVTLYLRTKHRPKILRRA